MNQNRLFPDLDQLAPSPVQARDAAIARGSRHADAAWMDAAVECIRQVAATHSEFTTDQVWVLLASVDCETHDNRAMAGALRRAQARGICEPTDRTRNSTREGTNAKRLTIWRSNEAQ